jgi:thiol-disulfide isomerase/thioredoxin
MINKFFFKSIFLILGTSFFSNYSCKKTAKTTEISLKELPWFLPVYQNYKPKKEHLENLKPFFDKNLKIVVFLGTWCRDSHREVPAFFKILDSLKFKNIEIYALDKTKKGPNKEEKKYNIHYLPTFIFYKKEKEIGRIIESPKEILEKDMIEIFLNQN